MYLKRLDIQGFKSFANKTVLEFGPGVTCVVGPNGTGKTNVADSLRWVLGEHASRQIRARKTEDVIFAGSDKRAPLGVAEVSIALDNSGHWLPVDFDEVVVSRRAYRNGENEYLINHARVRLRDVVELFQRAQVGQNSYAFMGQGMVEQALSLRPEDRRALVEEAADVRVYRIKLEDARNKLKATRENVERVRLLIREIEPRINQLERQAGRAVRHRELTLELAETLHVWYQHQWREVNDALLGAHTEEEQRGADLERARAEAKACDEALVQLRAAIDERRGEIAIRSERLRSMLDYVQDLERRVALDAERRRMLTERIDELADEIAALEAERNAIEEAAPLPDNAEAQQRLAQGREELAGLRVRLATLEQELHEQQRAGIAGEQEAARARALAEDAARQLAREDEAQARATQDAGELLGGRRALVADLKAWAGDFARRLREREAAEQELVAAERELRHAQDDARRNQQERDALESKLRALSAELVAAEAQLAYVERMNVQPLAPDAGVRLILEAGDVIKRDTAPHDVRLSGVRGLLGQLLRVPAGLERAIEAALADNLFAVVFDREEDVEEAVRLLLGGDRGRATMYALDNFVEARPLNLIKEKGVVGVASSLVRCDSRYRRLVDTLLGRTVIVENADIARRYVRRGIAHAVATTDGLLLRPVGSVAAGSIAIVQAALAYQRDAGELPADLDQLRAQIAELTEAAERTAARAADDARNESEAAARARLLGEAREAAQAALVGLASRLATMRVRGAELRAESRRRAAEAVRLAEQRQRAEAALERATREAVAAEERVEQANRAISDLEAARAQLAPQIDEAAAVVAQLDGQLRADRALTGGEREARERLNQRIAAKTEQRSRLEAEIAAIVSRLHNDERELGERLAGANALRDETEPARQELAQFESRERTLAAELMEANGRMRESERAHADAQNDVRLLSEELESLRVSLESEGFVITPHGDILRAPEPPAEPTVADGEAPPTWLRSEDADAPPPVAGGSTIDATEVRDRIADLRAQIRALGPVNEQAASDYGEQRERYDFLTTQMADLQQAETQLLDAVDDLEREIRERFRETFKVVNREFERYFNAFFRGGAARLELGENDDDGLPGVEIYAQPPGKKLGSLALLSGGEKSLTAVALLFALLSANPSPICVLDEVDAALDEANVGRFVDELRALSARTQFIIITHNRRTIENADSIYGVSMGADSVSRVLSLKLSDVKVQE